MVSFIQDSFDRRTEVIEEKLRNSFRAIKIENEEIKKKIEEISASLKNSTLSNDLVNLTKKVESNDSNFKVFKKEMARDSLKKEVLKEVMPLFNEKINVGLKLVKLENKELVKELNEFKSKWSTANEAKLNAGLVEMRANFKKLDSEVKANEIHNTRLFEKQNSYSNSEIKAVKKSTRKGIDAQNKLIDDYSAKLEDYSAELEIGYNKSKKEILASSERKFNALKAENEEELARLRGQIAYIKGRVNKEIGAEVETKPVKVEKKVEVKKVVGQKKPGFFSNIINLLADDDGKKKEKVVAKPAFVKVEVKEAPKPALSPKEKQNKNIFANLVSLLADESPEMKVKFTPAKTSKTPKVEKKEVVSTPVKKLGKQEENGFFNSIIKSLSD